MQTKESLAGYPAITREQQKEAYEKAVTLVTENVDTFTEKFPDSNKRLGACPKAEKSRGVSG